MKRSLSILLGLVVAGSILSGCGKSSEDTKTNSDGTKKLSGKITFATHRTDCADNTLKEIADKFKAENPGTEVEIESIKDPETVIKTRMAADEMPDIVQILTQTVKQNDFNKYFAPIDDLGFTKDNFSFFDQGKGKDGKLYGLSYGMSYAGGITYNKAVFQKAGITMLPKTLDEFYTDCDKIKAIGVVPFASNFKDKWPLQCFDPRFSSQLTGDVNYENNLAKSDKLFDDKSEAGMKILKTMKDKGYLEPDLMSTNWDGFKKDIAQGKVAMAFLGSWVNPQIVQNGGKEEDIGFFLFPGTKIMITGPDTLYAVAAHSKNLDLAKAFYKYLMSEGRYAIACGMIPANKDVKDVPNYVKAITEGNPPVAESVNQSDDFTALINKTQIDLNAVVQEYVMASDPASVVKKYNDKWAAARK